MPKRIMYIRCDCGKDYRINDDGTVEGAKVSEWQLDRADRISNTRISVKFSRTFGCSEDGCWITLKKQKSSKGYGVSADEDNVTDEEVAE